MWFAQGYTDSFLKSSPVSVMDLHLIDYLGQHEHFWATASLSCPGPCLDPIALLPCLAARVNQFILSWTVCDPVTLCTCAPKELRHKVPRVITTGKQPQSISSRAVDQEHLSNLDPRGM